jgi:hypothetical protein
MNATVTPNHIHNKHDNTMHCMKRPPLLNGFKWEEIGALSLSCQVQPDQLSKNQRYRLEQLRKEIQGKRFEI